MNKAVNNKKSVSCPAGGRNYGQSGRRILLFTLKLLRINKERPKSGSTVTREKNNLKIEIPKKLESLKSWKS